MALIICLFTVLSIMYLYFSSLLIYNILISNFIVFRSFKISPITYVVSIVFSLALLAVFIVSLVTLKSLLVTLWSAMLFGTIIAFIIASYLFYKSFNKSGLSIEKFDKGDYSKIFNSVKIENKEEITKLLKEEKMESIKTSFFGLMNQVLVHKGSHYDLLIKIDEFNKDNITMFDFKFNSALYKMTLLLLIQLKDKTIS